VSTTSALNERRQQPRQRRNLPPSLQGGQDDSSSSSSSPLEKSCFVCHLFLAVPVTVLVGIWIFVDPAELNDTVGYIQLPHPDYIHHIPVSLLLLFLAVPLLYCAANSMTVPDLQSTTVLHDQYTRRCHPNDMPSMGHQFGRSPRYVLSCFDCLFLACVLFFWDGWTDGAGR
jgi:thiosulfate reductase cytochrome b subunit